MKKPLIISIPIIYIVIFSCVTKSISPQIGTWQLQKIEFFDSTQQEWKVSEWMKNGSGTLNYSNDSMMSVEFLPFNYNVDSTGRYAYTAKYSFNKTLNQVTHTRLTHTDPKEIGKTVTRIIEIQGDTLTMNAKEFGLRLKWYR
ncbi:MAG: hypothetical protein ACPGEG_04110 [Salibacteraceae bacterium]